MQLLENLFKVGQNLKKKKKNAQTICYKWASLVSL